jgi:anti-anti-sigma factor
MAFDARLEMTGGIAKITLSGELDASVAATFKQKVEEAIQHENKTLVLFMQDLAYVASAGIRVLVFAMQKMGSNAQIYAIAPQDQVRETFEMTGLQHSLHIQEEYSPVE